MEEANERPIAFFAILDVLFIFVYFRSEFASVTQDSFLRNYNYMMKTKFAVTL